jgi:Membrane protein involved in colicin uptake
MSRIISSVVLVTLLLWLLLFSSAVLPEVPTDEELKALEEQIELQEAKQKAEAEAEAEAKQRAEAVARRKAEEEAKRKAEEERLRAEEVSKRKLEEDIRRNAEEEQRFAAEQAKRKEEERNQQEEATIADEKKQRIIEASRMERQKRSARTQDSFGYVDDLVARDLAELEQKQKQINISAKIDKWQSSGVLIKKGNTYKITATGQWSMGGLCNPTGPDGEGIYGIACWDLGNQTVGGFTHSALIGKIGAQNPAFFTGREYQFTSDEEGVLYFMANDAAGFFFDNNGSFAVTISVVN